MCRPRNLRRRGATVVETALVLGVCLMFVLGLFDFARLIFLRQTLTNAAREGARLAVVSTDSLGAGDIQTTVRRYLAGQSLDAMSIRVYKADPNTGNDIGPWNDAGLGECIGVEITGGYVPTVPTFSLIPDPVPVTVKSVMYSHAN
jgi:TadE-like protein